MAENSPLARAQFTPSDLPQLPQEGIQRLLSLGFPDVSEA